MSTPKAGEWKKRESFGSALVQIVVVALVLAGIVGFVYRQNTRKNELGQLMTEARAVAVKGNYADLKRSLTIVEQAIEKDPTAPTPLAFAAALNADLWLTHHEASAEAKAKELLERAKKANAQTEERFGVEAQLLLAAGNAKGAVDFVEELRKKGGSGARLFYAQALALKQQGNLPLARTGLTAAMDKAWKDGNYACAWGDEILEEGVPGAIDTFTKVTGQNPELIRGKLGLALARVQKRDRLGDAEALIRDVMTHKPELSAAQLSRAMAVSAGLLIVQEQYDQAISLAEQALAANSDDVWALFFKANALAAKKDPAAAASYQAVVKKAPWAPVYYFEGARRLQQAGLNDAAMQLLASYEGFFKNVKNTTADGKEVAWLDRDDRYWLARGDLLKEAGNEADALASYDKAIAAKSLHLAHAYLAKGAVFLSKKDFDKAGEMLQDITPQDGTGQLPEAYLAMGEILFAKKEWGKGCQNYAFALTRMRATQAPREHLNEVLSDVEKRLKAANQPQIAKLWVDEAKPLIQ